MEGLRPKRRSKRETTGTRARFFVRNTSPAVLVNKNVVMVIGAADVTQVGDSVPKMAVAQPRSLSTEKRGAAPTLNVDGIFCGDIGVVGGSAFCGAQLCRERGLCPFT